MLTMSPGGRRPGAQPPAADLPRTTAPGPENTLPTGRPATLTPQPPRLAHADQPARGFGAGKLGAGSGPGKAQQSDHEASLERGGSGGHQAQGGARGTEQGRQEAIPERRATGPVVRAGAPRGPPECGSGPHSVPAAPGALACSQGRCAQGGPRAFPCLEKHLVLIVILEKDENSPGATRREGRARWARGLASSPCAAGPARPEGCLQGPQHAPSPPRRSAETPSLPGTQASRGCRPGLRWLLTPGQEGVLSCVHFPGEEVPFPPPAGSSSQDGDHPPLVTGPRGVCGDGGVCRPGGPAFPSSEKDVHSALRPPCCFLLYPLLSQPFVVFRFFC